MDDKKNYSMYMPFDFDEKLAIVRENHKGLAGLSKSQAVYFVIAELADKYLSKQMKENK